MMLPTLGIVIATPGRVSLLQTLMSIRAQGLINGDDVLVVGDGYHKGTDELIAEFGTPFRYVATRKTRDWGHSQVNYGLKNIKADWVVVQDDDDVFAPRAFDEMRRCIQLVNQPTTIVGRVKTPFLGLLWSQPAVPPLDGHCILVPNDKKKLGYFGLEYAGDQLWIQTSLNSYDSVVWADRVWTLTRQVPKLWPIYTERIENVGRRWWLSRGLSASTWERETLAIINLSILEEESALGVIEQLSPSATLDDLVAILQYLAWAAQGRDLQLITVGDYLPKEALEKSGYKLHGSWSNSWCDYVHEWPPK